jgi:H2-forming N5,N10-methylenetetrahydromethanopterin dehydrogenase-like enzyme
MGVLKYEGTIFIYDSLLTTCTMPGADNHKLYVEAAIKEASTEIGKEEAITKMVPKIP